MRRAMRRVVLAHLCAAGPSEIQFAEVGYKKPRLAKPDLAIEFSSSHSGDRGIVVTGWSTIGVDIEALERPLDHLGFAQRAFAEEEFADIRRCHGNARREAFFNCWTGKEAYVKALGVGLGKSLRSFAVRCAPDEPPGLKWDHEAQTGIAAWSFLRFTDGEYVATIVMADIADAPEPEFRSLSLSSLLALSPQFSAIGETWRVSPQV